MVTMRVWIPSCGPGAAGPACASSPTASLPVGTPVQVVKYAPRGDGEIAPQCPVCSRSVKLEYTIKSEHDKLPSHLVGFKMCRRCYTQNVFRFKRAAASGDGDVQADA